MHKVQGFSHLFTEEGVRPMVVAVMVLDPAVPSLTLLVAIREREERVGRWLEFTAEVLI
jgi:hypothetical protein